MTDLLAQERNWTWLGVTAPIDAPRADPDGAAGAMAAADDAYTRWRAVVSRDDLDLSTAIGAPAGDYGGATRRSYVLHVIDELAHHCAEAALLRDLYECQESTLPGVRRRPTSDDGTTRRETTPISATTTEFAVLVRRGPAWDDTRDIRHQAGWEMHAAYMDDLVADGVIVVGGPVGEEGRILHFVRAVDEASARRLIGDDPWHRAGLLVIDRVRWWDLWLDGRT